LPFQEVEAMDADARFRAAPEVTWRDVPGELLLFDARADRYHVLNEAAAEVWRRLVEGASLATIAAALAEQFDVDEAAMRADISEAAGDFLARGLLIALDTR
jgi:PqqD family protein of HPr-rel-A system